MTKRVDAGVEFMPNRRDAWAKCITDLLDRHGLTDRSAAVKAGRSTLRTSIGEWKKGHVPTYRIAVDFLQNFPHLEAAECLLAAGYAPPPGWQPEPTEPLPVFFRKAYPGLPQEEVDALVKYVQDRVKEHNEQHRHER